MHLGDNLIIQAEIPLISSPCPLILRLNDTENPLNCEMVDGLTYNCSNLTASHTGVYYIYVSFQLSLYSSLQWESNRVTIIVQCKS